MLVCSLCRKPVDNCICTEEKKKSWEDEVNWKYDDCKKNHPELLRPDARRITFSDQYFEIDDDIADIIFSFWDKGYNTKFCCAGHLEERSIDMYITFAKPYFFDFTKAGFEEGWTYINLTLRYRPTQKMIKAIKEHGEDPYDHLIKQRKFLYEWIRSLPSSKLLDWNEKVPGVAKRGLFTQYQKI